MPRAERLIFCTMRTLCISTGMTWPFERVIFILNVYVRIRLSVLILVVPSKPEAPPRDSTTARLANAPQLPT